MRNLGTMVGHVALVAALGAACSQPARADDAGDDSIVVMGHGLAQTLATPAYDVQTVDREALLAAASGRIEDGLSNVAGLQQFRRSDSRSANPSAQGLTLRALGGNASARTLVLLDGVPMADPFFGFIPFSAIAPERLSSAQVTRGGGSGAFGAGAVAGTINLTSANAQEVGRVAGSALIDDRAETELSGVLAPKLGAGFLELSGRYDRGDGFWTTPVDQRVAQSVKASYNSVSAGARTVQAVNDTTEVQANVLTYNDLRTLRFAGANTMSDGTDMSLRVVGRGAWQFDALAYLQMRNFSAVTISSTAYKKSQDEYSTPSTGIGGKFELRPPVAADHTPKLGVDFRLGRGTTNENGYNTTTGAQTYQRHSGGHSDDIGLYAEDDWKLDQLVLTAGVRADHWAIRDGFLLQTGTGAANNSFANRSGWESTLRFGGVFDTGFGVKPRFAVYSGFRMPTPNELYRPFSVPPVTTNANANLVNERLDGMEAGLDWQLGRAFTLSATAFDDKVKHAIANVTCMTQAICPMLTSGFGVNLRQRQNVDAIESRGLEFDATARAGQFTLQGSLAFTDAVVQQSSVSGAYSLNGLRPAQTPTNAYSATLGWHPREHTDLSVTLRHVGAQYEDDLHTSVLPAASTIGAYFQTEIRPGLSLVLRGENLADVTVETRNQVVAGQPNSIDVGTPRTVWAGVKVRMP